MATRIIYPSVRIGQQFGRWTVLSETEPRTRPGGSVARYWNCRCICGVEKEIAQNSLVSGGSLSCGCLRTELKRVYKPVKVGQRFERLIVISLAAPFISDSGIETKAWECLCDCGNTKIIREASLQNKLTQSCGCLWMERISTHRMTRTPIYRLWRGIQDRCYNPNDMHYEMYGARGIYVDEEWRSSFGAFASYIANNLGPRPPGHTLDRIDNNGPYAPGNVRWATSRQQAANRRNNILVEWRGKTMVLSDIVREIGLSYGPVSQRLKRGWSLERALTTPVRPMRSKT
jgi:hypothetical protein